MSFKGSKFVENVSIKAFGQKPPADLRQRFYSAAMVMFICLFAGVLFGLALYVVTATFQFWWHLATHKSIHDAAASLQHETRDSGPVWMVLFLGTMAGGFFGIIGVYCAFTDVMFSRYFWRR
jgi:hypothetical protein